MPKNILLIEDYVALRQMLRSVLQKAGFAVVEACNSEDALMVFNKEIDLIISDTTMPGIDAVEFVNTFIDRKDYEGIPILFLTIQSLENIDYTEQDGRIINFIYKPFQRDHLLETIHEVLKIRCLSA